MDKVSSLKAEIKRLKQALYRLTPSLETLLSRRGFKIYKKEPSDDLLLPKDKYMDSFYEMMKRYSFRLFLRDVIKHQESFALEDVAKYATKEITKEYIDFLIKAGLIKAIFRGGDKYRIIKTPIKSFGETLEWFMAGLIKKEFGAETTWGVKFKRPCIGGDYDLLAKIDSSILYMEIKSSPPKQIYDKEIKAFLDRVLDLSPDISIFFIDTELRMKDKIVPMFEAELKRRYEKEISIERLEKEMFYINKKVFIINSKDSIEANIRTVLNFSLLKKRGI